MFAEWQESLCLTCIGEGLTRCLAAQIANFVADHSNLPPEEIHRLIAKARTVADARGCIHKNDFDPDYPGREGL